MRPFDFDLCHRPIERVAGEWTMMDLYKAVVAHSRRFGASVTNSAIQQVTQSPEWDLIMIQPEDYVPIIARLVYQLTSRPHRILNKGGIPLRPVIWRR